MYAGVLWGRFKTSKLGEVAQIYRDSVLAAYPKFEGARGGMLLIDKQSGESVSIGIYDSEKAAKSFQGTADQVLTKLQPLLAEKPAARQIMEITASTTQESQAVVERAIKAFNAHDAEALARLTAGDAEFAAPGGVQLRGPQPIKEFNQNWFSAFPDAKVTVQNIQALRACVVVEGTFNGTHAGLLKTPMGDVPPTGRKLKGTFVQVVQVDRGQISSNHLYYDQVQVMTQLGVMPAGVRTS